MSFNYLDRPSETTLIQRSDLDFVVDMPVSDRGDLFGLQDALEGLFERKVDLLEKPAVTNPYLIRAIKAHREIVYAVGEPAISLPTPTIR